MSSVASQTRLYFQENVVNVLPDYAYVWYGTKLSVFSAPITLEILGWEGEQVPAELSPSARREEEFTIKCCLSSYAGDKDFSARELTCVTHWNAISVMIGNDYTLGGNVRWAQMHEYNFSGVSDADGQALGNLDFSILCSQRVASLT